MNPWTILQRLNGMLVVILLAGCGGAPATPPSVSSAVTPTQARDRHRRKCYRHTRANYSADSQPNACTRTTST